MDFVQFSKTACMLHRCVAARRLTTTGFPGSIFHAELLQRSYLYNMFSSVQQGALERHLACFPVLFSVAAFSAG